MNLVDRLIDAAYDTGYYSGKGEYDQLIAAAILRREKLRHELLDLTRITTKDIASVPEVKALADALSELADLMDDIVAGEYTPDTFTTQPAHAALAAFTPAFACGASEVPE